MGSQNIDCKNVDCTTEVTAYTGTLYLIGDIIISKLGQWVKRAVAAT